MQTIDPLAAVHAERTIRDLLDRERHLTAETAADLITASVGAHFEYRSGQRRLVITTDWEVDPAAHTPSVP